MSRILISFLAFMRRFSKSFSFSVTIVLYLVPLYLIVGSDNSYSLTLSDYVITGKNKGYIDVNQLDNASFIDVKVSISGEVGDFKLVPKENGIVRISIVDDALERVDSFVSVTATTDFGVVNRIYSHSTGNITNVPAVSASEAIERQHAIKETVSSSTILTPRFGSNDSDDGEFVDGIINIEISGGIVTVGYALNHLAALNDLEVLILPGDNRLHDLPLIDNVSSFNDLYLASGKLVKYIYIDKVDRLVRIVGNRGFPKSSISTVVENVPPDDDSILSDVVPMTSSFKEVIQNNLVTFGYRLLVLPGDESYLNEQVEFTSLDSMTELFTFVEKHNGIVHIDHQNKVMRIKQ